MKRSSTKTAGASRQRRKRRSSEEIVQRIREAAIAEFKENGFDRATIQNIARKADVVEAQIFQYFNSKTNLFRSAIFDTLNSELSEFSQEHHWTEPGSVGDEDSSIEYTAKLQAFLAENAELLKSLFIASAYGAFDTPRGEANDSLTAYFDRGATIMRQRRSGDGRVSPEVMVRISFAAVLGCVFFKDWFFPEGLVPDAEIGRSVNEFIREGLNATTSPIAPHQPT